ncbi:MAG: glycosyltransferase, partial [Candidatus Cloacimonetes bacterium]|nr:glycosyltransferase [Candidatus Cloacimonadota bacterium]
MSENNLLVSIGIIVHNEAANIAKLLNALKNQNLNRVVIREIIIVSSASTDATDEIVEEFSKQDKRITLIREKERRGKSAAINLFLKAANSEILIIESGDTIPAVDTVEKLIIPFFEQSIGMTGGRPVPENSPDNFIGYSVNLLWNLHHKMALINPKLGEMVAFRRLFENLPEQSAVDEASIEALIRSAGLKLKYIGDALVYNKGPENLRDFIKQRKRIAAGHLWLKDVQNYSVASQDKKLLIKL